MPLARSRDYMSIGEVLDTVRAEFPDVSISKIRFLESEGLISPERTKSGYRKFYEGDVDRLRYILSLQRDQFLPLKVIRERLDEADSNGGAIPAPATPEAGPPAPERAGGAAGADLNGVRLDRDELLRAAELSEQQLRGLEEFGVLGVPEDGGYDEGDLLIAKAARKFFGFGVEPRHLRMYRQFAEREITFFQQIVSPVAAKRDPEGQKEAARSLRELAALSRQLKEGVLRTNLRELP
jgi:DNA-binding transcriptional MerR regulator